jgi:hypothetical protein
VTTVLAAGAALFMHEIPLRTHTGEAPAPAPVIAGADKPAGRLSGSPTFD